MIFEYLVSFHIEDCLKILSERDVLGYYSIKIDFLKLFETYPDVGDRVLCCPVETLPKCNKDINKVQQNILEKEEYKSLIEKLPFAFLKPNVHARFFGLPVCPELHRNIFPKNRDLGCFLKVTATVVRVTQSRMLEYQRKYVCMKCKYENMIMAEFEKRYILKAPSKCGNTEGCRCSTFTQISLVAREYCKDYQEIKIQEQVNKLSIGTIPGSMWVVLEDDLVDSCKPGDDVIICGTVRRRWRPSAQTRKSEVELVLQANYIEVINAQRSQVIAMAPDVKDCFNEFWAKYQHCPLKGRDQILKSVCPQVYGLYLVKLAVLLTVITGSNHILESEQKGDDHNVHVRGQCHLLLVGDPGTGKSQLLKASAELTPRSVFTSGAGSTRAGLTCAALREEGEWQLEAGALVLSDGGVCCIDEISHLRDHDRSAIHEAMEQQTISVAKAGIVCKLNTRCAIIAACNPKGHYQTDQPLSVNVSLGTPLLSRFDLIFILLDYKNKSWDKLVSSYILFGGANEMEKNKKWTVEKLQMYIGLIGPKPTKMSKSANTILQCYYMLQRKSEYRDPSRTTVRMLDSLIRLSQAHCRLMYRSTILPIDAIIAISLCDLSMQDCTLQDTADALHSTFLKYPDFDYLCKAKQLLTRMNLYEIWKEELLYYGKLLEVDHKTLENHIENKNYTLFSKYDDISDDNIPLSSSLVTSSYFKSKNKMTDNENNDQESSNNVITDKLVATLKKHATLNQVQKNPPLSNKRKYVKRKRKVIVDTSKFKTKKQKVKDNKVAKIDFNLTDESDVENITSKENGVNKTNESVDQGCSELESIDKNNDKIKSKKIVTTKESMCSKKGINVLNHTTDHNKEKNIKCVIKKHTNNVNKPKNVQTNFDNNKYVKDIDPKVLDGNKKRKKINSKSNSINISDEDVSDTDPRDILNCIPSVYDDYTKIGINFDLDDISSVDDSKFESDKESNNISRDVNKTAYKLKQFKCTAKHDLDEFNEKPDEKESPVKLKENKSLSNSSIDKKQSASSSQISMFESSDCEIDLDL